MPDTVMPFFIFLAHLISFGVLSDPLPDYVQSALHDYNEMYLLYYFIHQINNQHSH